MAVRLRGIRFSLVLPALLACFAPGLTGTGCAQEGRAGVVVRFAEGEESTFCVEVPGGQASALDLLGKTGLEIRTKDFGGDLGMGICRIRSTGTDDCNFSAGYWAVSVASPGTGAFAPSDVGAGALKVEPGGVVGLSWTAPDAEPSASVPSPATLEKVCEAAGGGDVPELISTPSGGDGAAKDGSARDGGSALPWVLAAGGAVLLGAAGIFFGRHKD